MVMFTPEQAHNHIHELRKARVQWVKILEASNYSNVEALRALEKISIEIDTIKGFFREDFDVFEPSIESLIAQGSIRPRFVSARDE